MLDSFLPGPCISNSQREPECAFPTLVRLRVIVPILNQEVESDLLSQYFIFYNRTSIGFNPIADCCDWWRLQHEVYSKAEMRAVPLYWFNLVA
jgi:hypothetical protein